MLSLVFAAALSAPQLTGLWAAAAEIPWDETIVWRNTQPPRNVQHLLLYVQKNSDGSLQAFLRNPEQNAGARVGMRTLSVHGNSISLLCPKCTAIAGAYSPADNTLTLKDPGLPGSFVFSRLPPITSVTFRDPVPAPYSYAPIATNDGWQTATLDSAGIDEAAIAQIVRDIHATTPAPRAPYIQSLLIARHGKLVLDEYFNGFDMNRPHDVRSAGKSVTTLMVGRAIEDTRAFGPNTPIPIILKQYWPVANDNPEKESITVANLMSMSAGYNCDDNADNSPGGEDTMQSQTAQPDWYKFTLDLPMLFTPGTRALYCTAEINLLGAIISKETGVRLEDYFDQKFAQPMQFGAYGMWLTPPPLRVAYMGGGDFFRPRDFLKFGQLFLNHGRWNGTQIIAPAWLDASATKQSYVEGGGGDYGYGWHLATYTVNGKTINAINAGGNGGQLLYIFPQLDMAVMITAANYGQYPVWSSFQTTLVPKILAAVK